VGRKEGCVVGHGCYLLLFLVVLKVVVIGGVLQRGMKMMHV
jgi:hypothetical protein